jgi:hypothetical protein
LRIEIDQIDDKSSELSGKRRPRQQAQAVFELPKIMPQSQKPFKGFLDLSLVSKKLRKTTRSELRTIQGPDEDRSLRDGHKSVMATAREEQALLSE